MIRPTGRPRTSRCDLYAARYRAGETVAQIARDVGRTTATVRDALVRRGVVARTAGKRRGVA